MLAIRIFLLTCIDLRHINRNNLLLTIPIVNSPNSWLHGILFICCSQGHNVWHLRGNFSLIELKLGNRPGINLPCAQVHSACFNCSLLFIPFSLYLLILFFQYSDQLVVRLSSILWTCHDFLFGVLAFTSFHL